MRLSLAQTGDVMSHWESEKYRQSSVKPAAKSRSRSRNSTT